MSVVRVLAGTALMATAMATGGCARQTTLEPKPGTSMPATPYGADGEPSADDLLQRPVQAAPERSVELRTRSEEREPDPFDLPPEG